MKLIRLFKNFDESTFSVDVKDINFSFYKPPQHLGHVSVKNGRLEWLLPIEYEDWGVKIGDVIIKSMHLIIEIDNGDENYEDYITIPEDLLTPEQFETNISNIENGEIFISSIDIEMNYSLDPKEWYFEITLGNKI